MAHTVSHFCIFVNDCPLPGNSSTAILTLHSPSLASSFSKFLSLLRSLPEPPIQNKVLFPLWSIINQKITLGLIIFLFVRLSHQTVSSPRAVNFIFFIFFILSIYDGILHLLLLAQSRTQISVEWMNEWNEKSSLNVSKTNWQINKKKEMVNKTRKVTFSYFYKIFQNFQGKGAWEVCVTFIICLVWTLKSG